MFAYDPLAAPDPDAWQSMGEGLDRHDAVHAVGGVLMGYLQDILGDGGEVPDINEGYYEELDKLTAAEWLKEYS